MKVLCFTPFNPVSGRSGAHRRILAMLSALRALGARVHLASCDAPTEDPWSDESVRWLERRRYAHGVSIFTPPSKRSISGYPARAWNYVLRHAHAAIEGIEPVAFDATTVEMRAWFARVASAQSLDRIVVNYVGYSPLLPRRSPSTRTMLETHDLISLHARMVRAVSRHMPAGGVFDPDAIPEILLDTRYFDAADFRADDMEYRRIDRFDTAVAITNAEAAAMREHTRHARVFTIPMPGEPSPRPSAHGPLALFPMGPHPFNLQGYAWFLRRVMPLISVKCPDFELGVSGTLYRHLMLTYHPRVRILGFVPDPGRLWTLGRFLVNPVFGGTGQPIKTIEAMAAGIPPIILQRFAHAAPITHGVNGFVAKDHKDFAECCVQLWRDPQLCRAMGEAALETIANACSRGRFVSQVARALE